MQDLRIILIVLGAVAIAALLIHGLWTSQKGRQKPIREKPLGKVANTKTAEPSLSEDEADGFDSDGVGAVKVVARRNQATSDDEDDWETTPRFSALNDDDEAERPMPPPLSDSTFAKEETSEVLDREASTLLETEAQLRVRQYHEGEIDPLFDEPIVKEAVDDVVASEEPAQPETVEVKTETKLEPEPPVEAESVTEPVITPPLREVAKTWQDVYVVNLVARPNQQFSGNDLKRVLADAGFNFGDMDIYHRHQTPTGQGEPLFSLINMVKPGTFNPNTMAEFSTPGVSLFMQLPKPGMAKNYFNFMVQTAEHMAEDLEGLVLDAHREPISPDYLARCREELRDYDSQAQ